MSTVESGTAEAIDAPHALASEGTLRAHNAVDAPARALEPLPSSQDRFGKLNNYHVAASPWPAVTRSAHPRKESA